MPTKYLSVKELAARLNVSTKTIYKKKLQIPGYFCLAGLHFFDEEVFLRSLKESVTKPIQTYKTNRKCQDDRHGLVR